jgi:hypothetical protein
MNPQLEVLAGEFEQAQGRLDRLRAELPDDFWSRRPTPERWSVSECVAHLNLTARAFLPVLQTGLEQAHSLGGAAPRRYRRDPVGWLLWLGSGPPARLRTRTPAAFVPSSTEAPAELRATFDHLQAEQLACVREASGLPLQKVKVASPFDTRVRYNLYSALSILARHQHRHLWQAEQVVQALPATDAEAPRA